MCWHIAIKGHMTEKEKNAIQQILEYVKLLLFQFLFCILVNI